jgi:hypothetical protein
LILLESQSRFLPWYRATKDSLDGLVKTLSDVDVMEFVSENRILSIPLSEGEREARSLPDIEVEEVDDHMNVSLLYKNSESLRLLRNLLHPTQNTAQVAFTDSMRILPVAFETRLLKRGFKETTGYSIVKKYIANKIDTSMLSLMIKEAETIRSGGRRSVDGQSVYEAPATPVLILLFKQVKVSEIELRETLTQMKPIINLVLSVKTQREIIHARLTKPVEQANRYREFIDLINKARSLYLITAEERRSLEKRWREIPEEREPIEEDLSRRIESPKETS